MCVKTSRFLNVCLKYSTETVNFHPLEIVGRGSETQLQVGESLNYLI